LPAYIETCRMLLMILGQIDQERMYTADNHRLLQHGFFIQHFIPYLRNCRKLIRNPERHGMSVQDQKHFNELKETASEAEVQALVYQRLKDICHDANEGRNIRIDVTEIDEVFELVDQGRALFLQHAKTLDDLIQSLQANYSPRMK